MRVLLTLRVESGQVSPPRAKERLNGWKRTRLSASCRLIAGFGFVDH